MKWLGKLMLTLLIIGCISCCGTSDPQPTVTYPFLPSVSNESRVPGEYIVTVYKDGDDVQIQEIFKTYSVQWVKNLDRRRFLVKVGKDPGPETIELEGSKSDIVKDVQPNYIKHY